MLPGSFMVNDDRRKISERTPSRAEAGLPESGFVFCCFNNSYKITPDVFDVWMRLLQAVEGSVLWLAAANASAVGNLRREAEARGVAADRLVFARKIASNEDHLARIRLADIVLDTLILQRPHDRRRCVVGRRARLDMFGRQFCEPGRRQPARRRRLARADRPVRSRTTRRSRCGSRASPSASLRFASGSRATAEPIRCSTPPASRATSRRPLR